MGLKVEIFLWFLGFSFCFLFVFLEFQTQENLRKKKKTFHLLPLLPSPIQLSITVGASLRCVHP